MTLLHPRMRRTIVWVDPAPISNYTCSTTILALQLHGSLPIDAAVDAQETTGASWFVWANPKPELAFFRDEDFGGDTPGVAFVPHPTADMPLPTAAAEMQAPYWIWQVRRSGTPDSLCNTHSFKGSPYCKLI